MLYEKILIVGQTKEGKKFRPSDWAERLYYTVASYGKNGRVIFNPLVKLNQEDNSPLDLQVPVLPFLRYLDEV